MLNRLAGRAGRFCTYPTVHCGSHVVKPLFTRNFASDPPPEKDCLPLANIVERRVNKVRSSLCLASPVEPPSSDEFKYWRDALEVADFEAAVQNCGERLTDAPIWVLLYLLSSKVHTPSQAVAAIKVILHHFPRTDKIIQPALIILAIRFLARQQVEAPVPNLIKLFLMLDLSRPTIQLNLLLGNMSHFKPSPTLAKSTTQVIDAMHGRHIKLRPRTYQTLLSNSLVSLELAKKLQQTMEIQGTVPDRDHLEAYLRVFAHNGAVHASARYLNLIREHAMETGGVTPHGVELSSRGVQAVKSENSVNSRWNTEFLMSFKRNTGSAFQYLRELVDDKDISPVLPRAARKESRIGPSMRKTRPLVWKHKTHVSDWATVLNIAARDTEISSDRLLQLFDETKSAAGYPPTVAIFTVLMRGLAKKGDNDTAMKVWERCCASWSRRRMIDTKALTVAMKIIVGAGYPLIAFDTLVETTGILQDMSAKPERLNRTAIGRRYERALYSEYAKIDVPLVNALMNAYQKNGRPDLVFKLWDVFIPLFGIHPNAETLTIVLDAAYSVARWDRTLRGLLEQLGLHNLFKSSSHPSGPIEEKTRWQIVQHMKAMIKRGMSSTTKQGGAAKEQKEVVVQEATTYFRKTLWSGELAAPKALKLFREILLGNYPELRKVEPSAKAVWPDEAKSTGPMRDALSSFGSRLRGSSTNKGLNETSSSSSSSSSTTSNFLHSFPSLSSPHPQITPTSQAFASYILLLSATNRPSEIALTLAWMHHLSVRPLSRSLALALALWAEASIRGPLLEEFGGRYGIAESEYDKLLRWLEEWLGRDGLPTERAVAWAFRKLKADREKGGVP